MARAFFAALLALVLALVALVLVPDLARSGDCTDGLDCFSDCILDSPGTGANVGGFASAACQAKGVPIRPRARIAADFEEITYWDGAAAAPGTSGPGSGGTACVEGNENANCYGNTSGPLWGPPYDPSGGSPSTKRGWNSAYYNLITHNTGSSGWAWQEGNPPSPTFGGPCVSGTNYCDNLSAIWSPDNRYNGNLNGAIYVYRGSELTQEATATITAPAAPFDGKQSLGLRFPSGIRADGQPHYFDRSFSVPSAVALAHASAYSNNFFNSSIIDSPIKHEEFGAGHPFAMWTDDPPGVTGHKLFPYSRMSMFTTLGESGCNAKRTAIVNNLHPGDLSNTECLPTGSFRFWPNPADYDQAIDFPAGAFRCMRSSMTGIGTTSGRLQTWIGEKQIIDFSNMDLTSSGFFAGYPADVFYMNRFSNRFQLGGGDPGGIDETVWQVEDNYVFETWSAEEAAADGAAAGVPLTCSQIGFGSAPAPPPPSLCCGCTHGDPGCP